MTDPAAVARHADLSRAQHEHNHCSLAERPAGTKAALFYFTCRAGVASDGHGHSRIEQLVDTGLVRELADLFALHSSVLR